MGVGVGLRRRTVRLTKGCTRSNCGSWLACDDGEPGNANAECADAIAGKPAPTFDLWCGRNKFCCWM
ncbi:hypothetical protein PflCFBP13514_08545 [Pseudomonas fluorescens]|nr:hypothetical protein PflCFBP13514_08545 [Pseudomonas fluorescens]